MLGCISPLLTRTLVTISHRMGFIVVKPAPLPNPNSLWARIDRHLSFVCWCGKALEIVPCFALLSTCMPRRKHVVVAIAACLTGFGERWILSRMSQEDDDIVMQ